MPRARKRFDESSLSKEPRELGREEEEEARELPGKCSRIKERLRAGDVSSFTPLKELRLGAVEHIHGEKGSLKKAAPINLEGAPP